MEVAGFNELIEEQIEDIRNRSGSKNAEYARGGDKLYNFRRAAEVLRVCPERALWGMFIKHFVSVQDIIEDLEYDVKPTRELLDEKVGDAIVYLILLKALMIDEDHVGLTKEQFAVGMNVAAKKFALEAAQAQYEPHGDGQKEGV